MKFSLIIPTLGRTEELEDLLHSISKQSYKDFEVIIVDQNGNGLIDEICNKFKSEFTLIHEKVDFKGAARSRNYGFRISQGEYINFPDDDSELPEKILEQMENVFNAKEADIIFCKSLDKQTHAISGTKLIAENAVVTEKNVYNTTIEYTMFLPREVFSEVGGFDPNLGVGTFYGAEEGADFVLRALYKNKEIKYKADYYVYHPEKINQFDEKERKRVYNYGLGVGRLAYKHIFEYKSLYSVKRYVVFLLKAFVGIFLFSLTNRKKSLFYFQALKGRIKGFLFAVAKKELYFMEFDKKPYN